MAKKPRPGTEHQSRESRIVEPVLNFGKTDILCNPLFPDEDGLKRLKRLEYSSRHPSKVGETPRKIDETGGLQRHKVAIMVYTDHDYPYWIEKPVVGPPADWAWPSDRWWQIDVERFQIEFDRFREDDITIGVFVTWTAQRGVIPDVVYEEGYHDFLNIPTGESLPSDIGTMQDVSWAGDYPSSDFFNQFTSDDPTDEQLQYFIDDFNVVIDQTDEVYTKLYIVYTTAFPNYFDYCAKFVRQSMDMECVRYSISNNLYPVPSADPAFKSARWMNHLRWVLRGEYNSRGYAEVLLPPNG
jgi:hypothetical protein